jgi:hypothetical protein
MKKYLIFLLFCVPLASNSIADTIKLSCSEAIQSSEVEARLLKQTPKPAARISEHILEIKYASVPKFVALRNSKN